VAEELSPETRVDLQRIVAIEREHETHTDSEEVLFLHEKRKKLGVLFWISATWVLGNIFMALFVPFFGLQSPNAEPFYNENAGSSWNHWLGTDEIGRDIFSRIIWGSRVSLEVGFISVTIAFTIGGTLAMITAYKRGMFDTIAQGFIYILLSFPPLIVLIAILDFWTPAEEWKIIVIITVVAIPLVYRVLRAATLSVATREYVLAATVQGAKPWRILVKEILPNVFPTALTFYLIGVTTTIILEGALAFLGLSVQAPTPSWGNMINEGRSSYPQDVWLVFGPSIAIVLLLLSLNFMGDRLRTYFDVTEAKL
jgi:peptide/nickel transport system permease protein